MFMDRNAQEVFSSQGFLSLSKTALLNIVLKDSFAAPEKDIFLGLLNLCKHNSKENHAEIMQAVCLPLMSLTELLNDVRPLGLWSPDAILDAIKVQSESRDTDFNYRDMLIPEENIATMKYGAQVVKGQLKSALSDGDTQSYDLDHGFSRHLIDDDCRLASRLSCVSRPLAIIFGYSCWTEIAGLIHIPLKCQWMNLIGSE
ncbi:hypothetical protein J1605_012657 [Eschrichtius robustus]|uniref:BACK domain-containing protein n=1 Tax=Eschrichtius robustus TaxID=9764 RepID=A0AB34GJD1_ESCRO|nr:hypothetical protein J1605_012657 [Eschrichtius robustus]